jgi:hypothetical protein
MTIGSKIIATVIGSGLFCSLGVTMADFASSLASDLIAASVSLVLG